MSSEHRNMLFAIALCLAFYLVYSQYLSSKYPQPEASEEHITETSLPSDRESSTSADVPVPQIAEPETQMETTVETPKLSPTDLTFETEHAVFRFNQDLSAFISVELKNYQETKLSNEPVQLLDSPLVVQGTPDIGRTEPLQGFNAERQGNQLRVWSLDGQWLISKTFTFPESGYGVDLEVEYRNESNRPADLTAGLFAQENILPTPKSGGFFSFITFERKWLIAGIRGSRDAEDTDKYCEARSTEPALAGPNETIDYLGFDDHYFLKVFQPNDDRVSFQIRKVGSVQADGCPIQVLAYQPQGRIDPGASMSMNYRFYFGPKEVSTLSSFDERLRSALYLGWIGFIAYPLLLIVQAFYSVIGNYGLAIIMITILLKILFYPLTKAATLSMKRMQKLQPKIQSLREKYKDDPKRQQQELMKFMSANKVNPAKGCLPILAQIPVFIAFYQVLSHAIELRHAPFFGWIGDLSVADPYYITPILLGVGLFLQQKLTPNPGMDPAVQRVMMFLPVAFTFMMLSLPAGMVIYMLANTFMSIGQQQWLNRKLA